jgi:hypothetical protein
MLLKNGGAETVPITAIVPSRSPLVDDRFRQSTQPVGQARTTERSRTVVSKPYADGRVAIKGAIGVAR